MEFEYLPLDDLVPWDLNPKKHATEQITRSIEVYGFNDPIGLGKDCILEGHGRCEALKAMRAAGKPPPRGITEDWKVPVIRLDLEGAKAAGYSLAHNRLVEVAGYDWGQMKKALEMAGSEPTFISAKTIASLFGANEKPAKEPADCECQLGQTWDIGLGSVLHVADNVEVTEEACLVGSAWVDGHPEATLEGAIVADPPFSEAALDNIVARVNQFGEAVLLLPARHHLELSGRIKLKPQHECVWRHLTVRRDRISQYRTFCLLVAYGPKALNRGEPDYIEAPYAKTKWGQSKPIEVMRLAVRMTDKPLIVDPWAGTLTTIMAAEAEGKRCIAWELDPTHAAIGLERCRAQGLKVSLRS